MTLSKETVTGKMVTLMKTTIRRETTSLGMTVALRRMVALTRMGRLEWWQTMKQVPPMAIDCHGDGGVVANI